MDHEVTTDYAGDFATARRFLDGGDIQGYWALMARHAPYAKTAGNVAANRTFWGFHANGTCSARPNVSSGAR